jgi:hypothetical protein
MGGMLPPQIISRCYGVERRAIFPALAGDIHYNDGTASPNSMLYLRPLRSETQEYML